MIISFDRNYNFYFNTVETFFYYNDRRYNECANDDRTHTHFTGVDDILVGHFTFLLTFCPLQLLWYSNDGVYQII